MTILEKLENAGQAKHWTDTIPTKYLYSYGLAGERFFREMKDNGRLMGAKCTACESTYLPPRLYCEECFEKMEKWAPVLGHGEVYSYTVAHLALDGTPLTTPEIIAFVKFKGIKGGLIHKLARSSKKRARIGMPVKPHFKPKTKRTGSIRDIEFFKPV